MPLERIDFTLPGAETAASAYQTMERRVVAVEFTSGGRIRQAGYAFDFGLDTASTLSATIYSDAELDYDSFTFSVPGLLAGSLTVGDRDKTLLLPLFF